MQLNGTDFQIKVWKALKKIKKGKVKTYKEIAIAINKPEAARAVANACAIVSDPSGSKFPEKIEAKFLSFILEKSKPKSLDKA